MSEDTDNGSQSSKTRSGHSFGVGPPSGSGDLPSVSGTRLSSPTAHSASSPLVESDETQSSSEMELDVTKFTESVRGPFPQRGSGILQIKEIEYALSIGTEINDLR